MDPKPFDHRSLSENKLGPLITGRKKTQAVHQNILLYTNNTHSYHVIIELIDVENARKAIIQTTDDWL